MAEETISPAELYDIESKVYRDFVGSGTATLSPEEQLALVASKLEAAGLTPGTQPYEQAFYGVIGSASISSYDYSSPYSGSTGNQTLKNWMSQNFSKEEASALGVDVVGRIGYSPDAYGWTNEAGEFVSPTNPWALDQYGNFILDETGNKILSPIYSFTQLFEKLEGRPPTPEEIEAGTKDFIAEYGYSAEGRTGGRLGWSGSNVGSYFTDPEGATGMYWDTTRGGMRPKPGYTLDPTTGKYVFTGTSTSGSSTSSSSDAGGLRFNPLTGKYESNPLLKSSAYIEEERQNAFELMSARFKEYRLDSLIPLMKQLIWDDVSEDTMWLRLQESDTFKQRFIGNEARRQAGLRVLSVREYINYEDTYRQVIRSYGLKQFDNDDYVSRFIANDVSITELTNRVTLAAKRLKDMPDIMKELKTFYGGVLADSDILGYVLDPKNELPRIERMVTAAEIGASAQEQGLQVGGAQTSELERIAAEDLASYGITQEGARQGYSAIAGTLTEGEKLSQIYGGRLEKYGQVEAEQEVFKGAASARRARQKLAATEIGTFTGGAGVARGAFGSETNL